MTVPKNLLAGKLLVFLILSISLTSLIQAEGRAQTFTYEAPEGEIYMLNEIGGIIVSNNDSVRIDMVLPLDARPKKYKDVDLMKGDIILMINGKSIKTVDDVKNAYEAVEKDGKIKIGIMRDRDIIMTSFEKSNQPSGMKTMIMTVKDDGDAEASFTQIGDNININIQGETEGLLPMLELGMILGEDDGVKILQLLPNIKGIFPEGKFVSDDLISAVNGTKIKTTDEFHKAFSAISPGGDVTLTIQRDGKTIEEAFKMPGSKMKTIRKQ